MLVFPQLGMLTQVRRTKQSRICCYVKRILIDEYSANATGREHAHQFFEIVIRTVFSVLFRLQKASAIYTLSVMQHILVSLDVAPPLWSRSTLSLTGRVAGRGGRGLKGWRR